MSLSTRDPESSPWICHVCGKTFTGESMVCSLCFRTTCPEHLCKAASLGGNSSDNESEWLCAECSSGQSGEH